MRLHEWIALEEGYYHDEGLEPETLADVMHRVSTHRGDRYTERPQDTPFLQGEEVANSACHWGSVCNAGAGKFVPDVYGVARFAMCVRPGSPMAEARGLRKLAQGEFRTLFWVSSGLGPELLNAYFRVLKRADATLRQDPKKYMPLWQRNIPPELQGDHDYTTFGLGELLFFEPYTAEDFGAALQFARKWGLHLNVRDDRYENLIVPLGVE